MKEDQSPHILSHGRERWLVYPFKKGGSNRYLLNRDLGQKLTFCEMNIRVTPIGQFFYYAGSPCQTLEITRKTWDGILKLLRESAT